MDKLAVLNAVKALLESGVSDHISAMRTRRNPRWVSTNPFARTVAICAETVARTALHFNAWRYTNAFILVRSHTSAKTAAVDFMIWGVCGVTNSYIQESGHSSVPNVVKHSRGWPTSDVICEPTRAKGRTLAPSAEWDSATDRRFASTNKFTPRKNHFHAQTVAKCSPLWGTWRSTKERTTPSECCNVENVRRRFLGRTCLRNTYSFTRASGRTSAMSAPNVSSASRTWKSTCERTPARNRTAASSAAPATPNRAIWPNTWEHTQGKNPSPVLTVTAASTTRATWASTGAFTRATDPTSVRSAGRVFSCPSTWSYTN